MNAGYKRMTRIIANRILLLMADLLQPSQHCGGSGNTVFEAVAAVRESIAHADVARTPPCCRFQGGLRQHFPYMPFCHVKELWVQRALHIPHPENVWKCHVIHPDKWTHIKHTPHTVLGTPRMPIQHATFRTLCEPPPLHPRRQTVRHSGWTTRRQNHRSCLRRWRHHLHNISSGHTQNTEGYTVLRDRIRGRCKHQKIQGHSSRDVGYQHQHHGYPVQHRY